MAESARTHDELYLREDRSKNPKEYFKFIVAKAREINPAPKRILDIGCASGDFLCYLRDCFPKADLYGMDVMESLVKATQEKVSSANVICADINSKDFRLAETFDMITMAGVHSIFDSCDIWPQNIANLLAPGGKAYIFGLFNPYPCDVLIQVRKAGESGPYEHGWNSFSKETATAAFKKNGCNVEFLPWEVPIDIAPNEADPLRTWTEKMADGHRQCVNGMRLIHDFHCAIISK